jgi:16S rRNA (cytosine967-C5)-methyltransferase
MALAPKADDVILDMCAAPGGKTCQMAIVTDDRAEIIATDIDAQRLKLIEKNAVRLKLRSINIIKYENLRSKTGKGYDKILIDVPCSNTGVLARRVEARYRVTSQGISRLSMVQRDILDDAAELIKAGGVICYSTCSLCKEENEDQVQKFLADRSDFELLSELLTLPSDKEPDHDGGYYALLKRK